MATERKFVEDKVYLQGPDGQIWEYEALLANQSGFTAVTPNPSKKAVATQEAEKTAADEEAARIAAEDKAAAEKEAARLAAEQKAAETAAKTTTETATKAK